MRTLYPSFNHIYTLTTLPLVSCTCFLSKHVQEHLFYLVLIFNEVKLIKYISLEKIYTFQNVRWNFTSFSKKRFYLSKLLTNQKPLLFMLQVQRVHTKYILLLLNCFGCSLPVLHVYNIMGIKYNKQRIVKSDHNITNFFLSFHLM